MAKTQVEYNNGYKFFPSQYVPLQCDYTGTPVEGQTLVIFSSRLGLAM